VKVSAVVISHGHRAELARSLPALLPQVDETVVIANVPGSAPADPLGARVIEQTSRRSFAANINAGAAATTGELLLVANPDTVAEPGSVAALAEFAAAHPRCGAAGPQMLDPDGTWQPSRRRFPTVGGTLVRRTPLRLLFPPLERQRRHYLLDERWYVPAAVVRHRWDAVTDHKLLTRRTIWHWRGVLRFVRKHPERLRALR